MTAAISRRCIIGAGAAAALAVACSKRGAPAGRQVADLWFTYGGKNRQVLEQLVRAFNASQSEHFIRAVYQGDYYEGLAKLRTALAAKAAPALSHVVGEVVPYLSRAGVLEQLDKYPGAHELGVVPELGQAGSWIGGANRPLVALPFNRSTPVAYLNGEIFDRERLAAPRTWQELRSMARRLTGPRSDGTRRFGFGCPIDWWFWVALVGQGGGRVIERDGSISLGGRAGQRAIEFWQALVSDDRTMKPPPGRDYNAWEQTNQDFLAGRTAMIWTSTAFLNYLEDNAKFPVRAAPLPADQRHSVPTGGTFWVVLAAAPGPEKRTAWEFLRFMHRPENAAAWAANTGYLPVTHGAIQRLREQGFYQRRPNHEVALKQLAVAEPWPWSERLFQVQREIVQPRLERAVLSRVSASEVLSDAQRLAREAL